MPRLASVLESDSLRLRPSHYLLSFSGPLLLTFLQVALPAVPSAKPAVEEVIAFLPRNFETDKTPAFSRNDWLLAFAAHDDGPEFHCSSPKLLIAVPCRTAEFARLPDHNQTLRKSSGRVRAPEQHARICGVDSCPVLTDLCGRSSNPRCRAPELVSLRRR
jgi:hypothetical protein